MASSFITVSCNFSLLSLQQNFHCRHFFMERTKVLSHQSKPHLTTKVSTRKLGLTTRMLAIQNMVCNSFPRKVHPSDRILQAAFVLLYTLISILVLHIFRKSARTGYVIMSILGDMLFTGVCIAILSIYSIAGVPADCGGLTRENCKSLLHQHQQNPNLKPTQGIQEMHQIPRTKDSTPSDSATASTVPTAS
jgi:hypothetical protein